MKVKKVLSLITSAVLCFGMLYGCGQASDSSGGDSSSDKKVIGFAQVGAESGWRTAETESIKGISELDSSYEIKFSDGQQKQENQIKAIRSFISQGVDLIALDPVVETGWDTVLQEAKDAGIPVVIVDRSVSCDDSLYECFLGSNMEKEGQNAAQCIIDEFGADATLNIVELQGTVGSSAAVGRQEGFNETIADCENYTIIKSESGDFTRAKGKEVMEAFLKSEGDNIDVLWAHNDDMAIGAIQAIEEYGLEPGKDIYIVSCDGLKEMFELMVEGKSNATVECNPLLGPQLLEVAEKILNGEEVEKVIESEESVYLQADAEAELTNRQY